LKKVRELQERVLPLVQREREEEGVVGGWQGRIEQRMLRLEGQAENMRKEMQLVLERRIVELENKWEERFGQHLQQIQQGE
jgi:hypothetical protein